MAEFKGTPGPWVAETEVFVPDGETEPPPDDAKPCVWVVRSERTTDGKADLHVRLYPHKRVVTPQPHVRLNAHLIAACPNMYSYIRSKAEQGDPDAAAIIDSVNGRAAVRTAT